MARSKFDFAEIASKIKVAEKQWLKEGLDLAKEEFDKNFDTKNDKGDDEGIGGSWEPLKYRTEPPPLLELTGEMRRQTKSATNQFGNGFGFFIIDPRDSRGRPYAEYHHTGTDKMAQRRTVVQSSDLDAKQLKKLMQIIDNVFNSQGSWV
jgi:hypothetical protein